MITRDEIVAAFEFCDSKGVVPEYGEYFEGDCACFVGAIAFYRSPEAPHGQVMNVEEELNEQGISSATLEDDFDAFVQENPAATWDDVLEWYDNYSQEQTNEPA